MGDKAEKLMEEMKGLDDQISKLMHEVTDPECDDQRTIKKKRKKLDRLRKKCDKKMKKYDFIRMSRDEQLYELSEKADCLIDE